MTAWESEFIREDIQDYEYLTTLRDAIYQAISTAGNEIHTAPALALLKEQPHRVLRVDRTRHEALEALIAL